MKQGKLILLFLLFSGFTGLFSQSVVVTDIPGYTVGDVSSMLDIKSTSKGFLIPRVTLTSSLSSSSPVSSPATGLLVYNEGANQPLGFYYWNGSAWASMAVAGSADGSETKISSGTSVSVTGSGTTGTPYIINYSTQTVTYDQRGNLSPVTSQMVICSDCGSSGELQVWNGSAWTNITGGSTSPLWPPSVGDSYQGGKIAYILQPGDLGYVAGQTHGLIAAVNDQSTSAPWGCQNTIIFGAGGIVVGTGNQNTIDIEAGCIDPGIASDICANLTEGGYSDWYLPSVMELGHLYTSRIAVGGYELWSWYWSSTELNGTAAYRVTMNGGTTEASAKFNFHRVRAIRAF